MASAGWGGHPTRANHDPVAKRVSVSILAMADSSVSGGRSATSASDGFLDGALVTVGQVLSSHLWLM